MEAGILVPILVPLGAFAMVFGIIYLRTRENMAMIEKGLNPKQFANRPAPYRNLKNGLLFLGAGLGLLIAYLVDNGMSRGDDFGSVSEPLYFACVAIGGGLGLIASYAIEKKEVLNRRSEPFE
ncbi:MAG TPA: DUF6249 domain-containing protein [Chitinophagaceae bacterium]|nr:DUF6249 domain-containing protein [Chitinophagaceae bacterium]